MQAGGQAGGHFGRLPRAEPARSAPRARGQGVPEAPALDAWLAAREAGFDDLVPGCEKRVIWARSPGMRSGDALVYLHGFSASSEEIRPVPDMLATRFGANLFYTRLAGHGRSGAAMAEPRAGDWLADAEEAIEIGARLGERVWLIGTSTGGTLAALAAADPRLARKLAGVVLISPNFGLGRPDWQMLNWPLARHWLRLALGGEIGFLPSSERHETYWSSHYPPAALAPMAQLARRAARTDFRRVEVPVLVLYAPQDKVISVPEILRVTGRWGAISGHRPRLEARELGEGDDPACHILAGDVLSPGQTESFAASIGDWIGAQRCD